MRPLIASGFRLALVVQCCWLLSKPLQASEPARNKARAGLDGLSQEMSTCAAYFSLLSSIVESSARPERIGTVADRIKQTGQEMLTEATNIATYIGMNGDVSLQRVQVAMKEMVEVINSDPPNSLATMHVKYGQRCDELLVNAPQRFVDLLEQYGD
jgi:hypothetical protein